MSPGWRLWHCDRSTPQESSAEPSLAARLRGLQHVHVYSYSLQLSTVLSSGDVLFAAYVRESAVAWPSLLFHSDLCTPLQTTSWPHLATPRHTSTTNNDTLTFDIAPRTRVLWSHPSAAQPSPPPPCHRANVSRAFTCSTSCRRPTQLGGPYHPQPPTAAEPRALKPAARRHEPSSLRIQSKFPADVLLESPRTLASTHASAIRDLLLTYVSSCPGKDLSHREPVPQILLHARRNSSGPRPVPALLARQQVSSLICHASRGELRRTSSGCVTSGEGTVDLHIALEQGNKPRELCRESTRFGGFSYTANLHALLWNKDTSFASSVVDQPDLEEAPTRPTWTLHAGTRKQTS
ncbi:uncharacterized protein BDZ99DRAFT_514069 [Mytilinidion resinicola]|uniref:Uncharacterized protein n=1 Tax=Mytilinidion resinicola TaxID=574789 RepID=A0A6A6ZA18_9PEZI|nr:uncharacterized protein BDZ99DRAFT_514069 [Mytilinidion resinicola]KAF2817856.1 hypothetical protein BDZ99DRAFT_514069 [Mytilinidion resinicola]